MDLSAYELPIKLLHVLGAFLFVAGHGVSMTVAFKVRRETDVARMAALLDVSSSALGLAFGGVGLLFLAGILGGIAGGFWGQGWLTVSVILFIVAFIAMTPMIAIPMGNLRRALGIRTPQTKPGEPLPPTLPPEEAIAMARALKVGPTAAVGGTIFLVVLALMVLKPF